MTPRVGLACIVGLLVVLASTGCCSGPQPDAIIQSLRDQLDTTALLRAEVIPLLPETPVTFGVKETTLRQGWHDRVSALMVDQTAVLAWALGEGFDPARAYAVIFGDDE